jgi:hypothetical protein
VDWDVIEVRELVYGSWSLVQAKSSERYVWFSASKAAKGIKEGGKQ